MVHTYSGYENKVKANIEKDCGKQKYAGCYLWSKVPVEEQIEIKNGKRRLHKKIFLGMLLSKW